IGDIQIQIKEIFDLDDPKENNWLFRTADHLHVRTRESAIRAQLLFRSGDPYSRRVLEETARNLRQNSSFMREPEIHPVRYHGGGSTGVSRSVVTRYSLGNPYDAYQFDWRVTDFYFGQALLIDGLWTERLLFGFRHDQSVFTPALNQTLLAPLPADRNLAYPYLRMQWVQNNYTTTRNLDLIAFTEDLHFGLDASVGLGWATPAFSAD